MHENSTLNYNAGCISAQTTNAPMRPKAATIEKILQFSAAYNPIKTHDGHIIEAILN